MVLYFCSGGADAHSFFYWAHRSCTSVQSHETGNICKMWPLLSFSVPLIWFFCAFLTELNRPWMCLHCTSPKVCSEICIYHFVIHFFLKKLKAGALPYHIRRRINCTSHAEENATTRKQRTQQDTTPPQPGRRAKEATTTCVVAANTVPRPKPQSTVSSSGHLSSSTMIYHHQATHTRSSNSLL
jgi:hypothetical protein